MMKTTIEMVIENLEELELMNMDDWQDEIIAAFEDYEYEGETEVIITTYDGKNYQAYVNHVDAPIVSFKLDMGNGYTVGIYNIELHY